MKWKQQKFRNFDGSPIPLIYKFARGAAWTAGQTSENHSIGKLNCLNFHMQFLSDMMRWGLFLGYKISHNNDCSWQLWNLLHRWMSYRNSLTVIIHVRMLSNFWIAFQFLLTSYTLKFTICRFASNNGFK